MTAGNIADRHAGLHRLGNHSQLSVEKWRRRATPVITSTFENVSDIGVCLGVIPRPLRASARVRSKRGALHPCSKTLEDSPPPDHSTEAANGTKPEQMLSTAMRSCFHGLSTRQSLAVSRRVPLEIVDERPTARARIEQAGAPGLASPSSLFWWSCGASSFCSRTHCPAWPCARVQASRGAARPREPFGLAAACRVRTGRIKLLAINPL